MPNVSNSSSSVEVEQGSGEVVPAASAAVSLSAQKEEIIAKLELLKDGNDGVRNLINAHEQQKSAPEAEPISKTKRDLAVLDTLLGSVISFFKKIDDQKLPLYLAAFGGLRELLQSGHVLVSFGILYLAVNVLEVGKDYYKTERDSMKRNIDDARDHVEKIAQLLKQASVIMTEMVNEASSDDLKVSQQFHDCIVQAVGEGKQCKNTLDCGNKTLKKIFWRLRCRLWAFNGVKCLCTAGVLGGFYKVFKDCTSPMSKGASILVTFGVCYGICNWKLDEAAEVYENLKRIQLEFMELELKLDNFTIKIDTENERMTKRKQSGSQAT